MSEHRDRAARDEAVAFAQRLQAEIAADAEVRRRRDPELERRERDIERAWAHLAPPGATGPQEELLLDRVERLSLIDVDAPLGARVGVRQVKGAVRKGTYWYLRYVSDQLNALHNVQGRLLRRVDSRLARLERAAGFRDDLDRLLDPPPRPGDGAVEAIAASVPAGPVLVCDDASGVIVAALDRRGIAAHGVASDATAVLEAVERGTDVRVADPAAHLEAVDGAGLGAVVLRGFVERMPVAELTTVVERALAALRDDGWLVVAADEPAGRGDPERELLAGRGLGSATWAHLLSRLGAEVELVRVDDGRLAQIVVARRP